VRHGEQAARGHPSVGFRDDRRSLHRFKHCPDGVAVLVTSIAVRWEMVKTSMPPPLTVFLTPCLTTSLAAYMTAYVVGPGRHPGAIFRR